MQQQFSLKNKTAIERATVKSEAISKLNLKGKYTNAEYGVEVEIVSDIKHIEINGQHGIEFYARAWKNRKPLALGTGVEIEKFRIFNPPILVDDPNGDIVREWTDHISGKLKQRKLREDPAEAIRQSLSHTISLIGKEDTNIIKSKVGNTTSTFYSDAGGDGWVDMYPSTGATWATIHDATVGVRVFSSLESHSVAVLWRTDTNARNISRGFLPFDTSGLPDTDIITSATLSLYESSGVDGRADDNDAEAWVNVVQTTQASNTALTLEDYDQCGAVTNPTEGATRINLINLLANIYNTWTLNATGISWINKTGYTKLGVREGHDVTNSPIASDANYFNQYYYYSSDQTGTANDPKLVVVHTTIITVTLNEAVVIVDTLERATNKVFSEVVTIVDSMVRQTGRIFSEVITIVDFLLKQGGKVLSEAIVIVDSIIRTPGKVLSEAITIVDSFIRAVGKIYTEVVAIVDSIIRQTGKIFSEVMTIVDIILIVRVIFITLITEAITIVDSFIKSIGRIFTENINFDETLIRGISKTFSETTTIVDTTLKRVGKMLTETITLEDIREFFKYAVGLILGLNKNINISQGTRDEIKKGLNKNTGIGQGTPLR